MNDGANTGVGGGRRYSLVVFWLLTGPLYYALVTYFNGSLWEPIGMGNIFDHLAIGLLQGRTDLPPSVIGPEAFVVDGKHYAYWGVFPALFRLPLALTGTTFWIDHTSRISCLLAALLSTYAVLRIIPEIRWALKLAAPTGWYRWFLVAGLTWGSLVPFLLVRPHIYHEVILWCGALALLSAWLGLRAVRTESNRDLVWMILLAGAAASTRATLGFGALIGASLVLAWEWIVRQRIQSILPSRWKVIGMVTLFLAMWSAPFLYNYVRFGTLARMPYESYLLATPERLAKTNSGRVFQPVNLLPNFTRYFDPRYLEPVDHFPYVAMRRYELQSDDHIEHSEPYGGIPSIFPGVCLLAVIGIPFVFRSNALMWLACGGAAAGAAILSFSALSHRYIHDFSLLFTLLAASGGLWVGSLTSVAGRISRTVSAALLMSGLWISLGLAVSFPGTLAPDSSFSTRIAYTRFATRWDAFASKWFGLQQQRLEPEELMARQFRLEVTFPAANAFEAEPILTLGEPGRANLVYVASYKDGTHSIGADAWGYPARVGPIFRPQPGPLQITVTLDAPNGRILVSHGDLSYELPTELHPYMGKEPHVGVNPFGGTACGARFPGQVRLISDEARPVHLERIIGRTGRPLGQSLTGCSCAPTQRLSQERDREGERPRLSLTKPAVRRQTSGRRRRCRR